MKCVNSQLPATHSISPKRHGQLHRVEPINLCWLSGGYNGIHYNNKFKHRHNNFIISQPPLKPKPMAAIHSSLLLGVAKPAGSGDVTVLLQTGALMLLFYCLANFVVPQIILKNMEPDDEENDDQKATGEKAKGSDLIAGREPTNGRGFNSTIRHK